MRFAVEIRSAYGVADTVCGLVVEHEPAEHRLLRLQRVRRQLEGIDLGIVRHGVSSPSILTPAISRTHEKSAALIDTRAQSKRAPRRTLFFVTRAARRYDATV